MKTETGETINLLPCPFCGHEVECIEEWQSSGLHEGGFAWVVRCNYLHGGCGAKGGGRMNQKDAIEAWTKRYQKEKEIKE